MTYKLPQKETYTTHKDYITACRLWFASHNVSTVPVHGLTPAGMCTCGRGDCNKVAKHPYITAYKGSWKTLATAEAKRIRSQQASGDKWLNYGVMPTKHTVIDVDSFDAWQWFKKRFNHDTFAVRTAKGFHLFYFGSAGTGNTSLHSGIDIRSDGNGYVVGLGSRHASGKKNAYTLANNAPCLKLPDNLRDALQAKKAKNDAIPAARPNVPARGVPAILERLKVAGWHDTLALYNGNAGTGDRSRDEFILACGLLKLGGVSDSDIKACLISSQIGKASEKKKRGERHLDKYLTVTIKNARQATGVAS